MFESLLLAVLALILQSFAASAQAVPERFSIGFGTVMSANGSSSDGGCDDVSSSSFSFNCRDETGGVIFDGLVPNLTTSDFQGDEWARELLTILTDTLGDPIVRLVFPVPISVEAIEIVMFNCPEWEASVDSVSVLGTQPQNLRPPTSCDSLVSVCLPVNVRDWPLFQIQFTRGPGSDWIHIAEVKVIVRGSSLSCSQPPRFPVPRFSTVPSEFSPETSTRPVQNKVTNDTGAFGEQNCPSNRQTIILASVISALAAIILYSVFFSMLLMAICRYHPRFREENTKLDELIRSRNSARDASGNGRAVNNVVNCQETGVAETYNGASDSRYFRASEIFNDSIMSREARNPEESYASERSSEDCSYENTSGIYVEVDDVATRDTDIKLFKNQSYCVNTLQQLPPQASIRLVPNQSYGTEH